MRKMLLGAAALATLVLGAPVSASAGTLDQQQTDSSGGRLGTAPGSAAQTFTAGISGKLDEVDLDMEESGVQPLVVEIRDVPGGVPGDTVLARHSVPGTDVSGLGGFVPVRFDSPAPVAAGTLYAIVAYTSDSSGGPYRWAHSLAANPYPAGSPFTNASSPPSGSWTLQSTDFAFKTHVVPTPAGPTGQRAAAVKKCKKKRSARARKHCRKKAKLLPV